MAKNKKYTVKFRRKRKNRTDYAKRLSLISSRRTRLVIRKQAKNIIVQFVDFGEKGDKVIISVTSQNLNKFNWAFSKGNMPSAYLTGLLAGVMAKKKGIKSAILDIGLNISIKGTLIYAALKGVLDGGIEVPHSKEVLPDEKRLMGEHIANYANELKSKSDESYKKQFSDYIKKNINVSDITKQFNAVKSKIMESK